jgi:hypothetical protein
MSETNGLTQAEKATNYETLRHIEKVRNYLNVFVSALLDRGAKHDQSKLAEPEVQLLTETTPRLPGLTYGSPEYEDSRKSIATALAHHYANNRHHPEHFKNGVDDMNLLDIVEMLCDWKASSERHNDGNIRKSITINADRFNLSPQLVRILENTAELFDK